MKGNLYTFIILLFVLALPVHAQSEPAGGEYAVEEGIEDIFAECLKEIKEGQRKRIELYTCVNLGLQKKKAEEQPKQE